METKLQTFQKNKDNLIEVFEMLNRVTPCSKAKLMQISTGESHFSENQTLQPTAQNTNNILSTFMVFLTSSQM